MLNEEFPTQIRMLAGVRVKGRNLRHLGRIPSACFQDQNPKTISGKIAGKRRTACAGADDDEVVLRSLLFWMERSVVHFNQDTTLPFRACVARMSSANRSGLRVPVCSGLWQSNDPDPAPNRVKYSFQEVWPLACVQHLCRVFSNFSFRRLV